MKQNFEEAAEKHYPPCGKIGNADEIIDMTAQELCDGQVEDRREGFVAGCERLLPLIEKAFIAGRSQQSWESFVSENLPSPPSTTTV
jgi:hypothetical protein